MTKSKFEQIIESLLRKGLVAQVDYLRKLDKLIVPTHKKLIQEGNKAVLKELVLPKWLSWETLEAWANKDKEEQGRCLFCDKQAQYSFKSQNICKKCIETIKKLGNQ